MSCPFCSSASNKVVDKRPVSQTGEIRRRRECLKCQKRFTTYERVVNQEIIVIKKDNRREVFDRGKLLAGIVKALEKRPFFDKSEELTDKIECKLRQKGQKEISSKQIGQLVLTELRRVDKVAYLRFASVYRSFEDPTDFARELTALGT